jgi:hypothetical protein
MRHPLCTQGASTHRHCPAVGPPVAPRSRYLPFLFSTLERVPKPETGLHSLLKRKVHLIGKKAGSVSYYSISTISNVSLYFKHQQQIADHTPIFETFPNTWRWLSGARLHGSASQKTAIFLLVAVKISNFNFQTPTWLVSDIFGINNHEHKKIWNCFQLPDQYQYHAICQIEFPTSTRRVSFKFSPNTFFFWGSVWGLNLY